MVEKLRGQPARNKRKIRSGVDHSLKGEGVIFKLKDEDHTFSRSRVNISDEGLFLKIKGEAPEDMIHLLDAVVDGVGIDRMRILQSTKVDIVLRLDDDLFTALKDKIMSSEGVREVFEIEYEGFRFLKDLSNYFLEEYTMITRKFKVHVGGKLVEAIKRKL